MKYPGNDLTSDPVISNDYYYLKNWLMLLPTHSVLQEGGRRYG
jgi:hypothetical protein